VLINREEGDEGGMNGEKTGKEQGKVFSDFLGLVALSCH
jgi:hypothetical protein